MSSFNACDPKADNLLERIRNLKELLRSDIGPNSPKSSPESGRSSPSSEISQMQRQTHFSPPTKDQKENSKGEASDTNNELIEETWHLLTQVTYVRIVVDRLTWDEPPKIFLDAVGKRRGQRQRSSLFLEYCFPMITASDGSVSARDLGKRMLVPAKDVLRRVAHFNHRRVILLRMTEPVLQLWAHSYFTIKVFCGSKPNSPIGKCIIPLCKLLVLPFSLDAYIPVEMASETIKGGGKLKMCIQLGSRFQSFTERVEPMRNPTTEISELAFIDPMKLIPRLPTAAKQPISSERSELPPSTPTPGRSASRTVGVENLPSADEELRREYLSPSRRFAARRQESNVGRPLNETFTDDVQRPSPLNLRNWYSRINDNEDDPAWLRYLLQKKGDGAESWRSQIAEPYVGNISVYGNRVTVPPISRFENVGFPRTAAVEAKIEDLASIRKTSDAAVQTSTVLEENPNAKSDQRGRKLSQSSRRPTVAEKLLMNRFPIGSNDDRELMPSGNDHGGFWLQLALHRARNLPMVKGDKSQTALVKPTCYWTFADDSGTRCSPTSVESCEPVWDWSAKIFVPPERKTLVLKLWHKGSGGRDRVLGFVAIFFPIMKPFERVWYDIIDLARSSTGQIEMSFDCVAGTGASESQQQVSFGLNDGDRDKQRRQKNDLLLSPSQSLLADNDLVDAEVNTTMAYAPGNDRRSSTSSPFIALTSRSFLTRKLKANLEELTTLTDHLRQSNAPATAPTDDPEQADVLSL